MLNWRSALVSITRRMPQLAATAQGERLGVLLLRVRRLRTFNQQFGHAQGDMLMHRILEVSRAILRPTDAIERVGDAEFLIVLPQLLSLEHGMLAAARLQRAFAEPIDMGVRDVLARIAIGLVLSPDHGSDAETLLQRVDRACARAVDTVSGIHAWRPEDDPPPIALANLQSAIRNNQLQAWLQPIVDLRSGALVAVESLARWLDEDVTVAAPDIFVPLAEQASLITPLTRWSFNVSAQHAARIEAETGRALKLSINLSPHALTERAMVEQILESLRLWQIEPERIVLEVTETAVMQNPEAAIRALQRLRELGFGIAVDDFGVGNASYTYLRRVPLTEMKIDRSFVADIVHDPRAAKLVQSMIQLAHALDGKVVAEGIESSIVQQRLCEMGCDFGQGYAIGWPQPIDVLLLDQRLLGEAMPITP